MKIDFAILGGGGVEPWFANEGVPNKGMLSFAGKPSIEYVIDALRKASLTNRIILVGNGYPDSIKSKVDLMLEEGDSQKANIDRLVDASETEYLVVTTNDIPLVTEKTFDMVVSALQKTGCDLGLPIITKEDTLRMFPGTKRTFLRIKEGNVKIGNLFYISKTAYKKVEPIVEETSKRRKSAIKQALQLGVPFLLRLLLFKNVGIPELEKRISKMLGVTIKAPVLPCPELGVDVDKIEDLEFCRSVLEAK